MRGESGSYLGVVSKLTFTIGLEVSFLYAGSSMIGGMVNVDAHGRLLSRPQHFDSALRCVALRCGAGGWGKSPVGFEPCCPPFACCGLSVVRSAFLQGLSGIIHVSHASILPPIHLAHPTTPSAQQPYMEPSLCAASQVLPCCSRRPQQTRLSKRPSPAVARGQATYISTGVLRGAGTSQHP